MGFWAYPFGGSWRALRSRQLPPPGRAFRYNSSPELSGSGISTAIPYAGARIRREVVFNFYKPFPYFWGK